MHSFKKISDYPGKPCKLLTSDRLATYDKHLLEVLEQSRRMEYMARATNPVIYFYTGR